MASEQRSNPGYCRENSVQIKPRIWPSNPLLGQGGASEYFQSYNRPFSKDVSHRSSQLNKSLCLWDLWMWLLLMEWTPRRFKGDSQSGFLKINLFNWRLITLQYCSVFAILWHESAMDIDGSPILKPPPTSLPIPSLRVIPVHWPWAPCLMHQTWTGDLFHIWLYTCFNAILSNHPTLAFSHRVPKSVLYTCVCFGVSHIGSSLPSL